MFQLIYPLEDFPLQGAAALQAEIVPLVDSNGLVVGRATREYCHSGSMALHPVVHLHIINRYSQLYIQKRGPHKDLLPNRWDTAVGGHVGFGESLEEALYREAEEELRFRDFNPVFLGCYEHEGIAERELVSVFATISSATPSPDGDEVTEGRWWSREEIDAALGHDIFTPNFEAEYKRIKAQLFALL